MGLDRLPGHDERRGDLGVGEASRNRTAWTSSASGAFLDSTGEGTFARRVLREPDSVVAARGATLVPAFGYDYVDYVPGQPRRRVGPGKSGERARHVEIGYFITRSGHGDELLYRSTLRDAFTLTTGVRERPWSARPRGGAGRGPQARRARPGRGLRARHPQARCRRGRSTRSRRGVGPPSMIAGRA
ncbi:hypothetical protein STRIP9103_09528 [Streptomyces ipomoeae 91-03]|uniref:Uncharacterized protein n=1 Tax=Streptomyces ipomoeae 91-03 TaxID=698759 RepID=L1L5X2_9ACTN|nr:hypothetical protein STRIP9103_09528 [Streptomyces ipomoeae 91-03]